MSDLKIYIDGGCNNLKDIYEREMIAVVWENDLIVERCLEGFLVGGGSSNVAELLALYEALKYLKESTGEVEIYTDSKVIIAWMENGVNNKDINNYKVTDRLRERCVDLMEDRYELEWIPREDNLAGHYIEETYGL